MEGVGIGCFFEVEDWRIRISTGAFGLELGE